MMPRRFGSYEPQLASFVSLPYLGSRFSAGQPTSCVHGFDNAGLMIGTSACTFNAFNITNSSEWTSPQALGGFVSLINETFGALQPNQELDVTSVPNPFYKLRVGEYQDAEETALSLFDGSLDDQNDPLFPLLVKKRAVDMVVVLDSVRALLSWHTSCQGLTHRVHDLFSLERRATSSRTVSPSWRPSRKSACSPAGS